MPARSSARQYAGVSYVFQCTRSAACHALVARRNELLGQRPAFAFAEEKALKDWRTERYHAPSDDTHQPVDLATAAGYEEVIRALTVAVANDPARPAWKPESFFRRYAAGGTG